jgi:RNA 2',3'-cyclic 3'-phosphodiesterase
VAAERLKSPRVRLFVALDLPAETVTLLSAWTRATFGEHPDLRVLRPESLHVTLVFLGYQYERDIDRITDVTFAKPFPPVRLQAEDVQPVPRSRPRLFALALADQDQAVTRWTGGLAERLQRAGFYEPEKRPFWPHVTLVRAKRGRTPRGIEVPGLPDDLTAPFSTGQLTLYRSTLRPQGAVYEPLARGTQTTVH